MARRKKKSAGFGAFIAGTLLLVAAAGVAYYGVNTLHWGSAAKTKPKVTVTTAEVTPQQTVYLYLVKQDKRGYHLGKTAVTTRDTGEAMDLALNALFATNKQQSLSSGLIPEGTKLLEPVKVERHIAVANLSKDFVDNFSGGSEQEAATVNSIVSTLVDNSGGKAHRVQILVEGKKVESLGGHFVLTDPISEDPAMLRPGSLN